MVLKLASARVARLAGGDEWARPELAEIAFVAAVGVVHLGSGGYFFSLQTPLTKGICAKLRVAQRAQRAVP
jgi:hypothetical protein